MPAPTPELDELGTMIRTARDRSGLNQTQLGEKIGLSQPSVSAIEDGTRVGIDVVLASDLAKALGLSVTAVVHAATLRGERHRGRAPERQGPANYDLDDIEPIDLTRPPDRRKDPSLSDAVTEPG